MRRLIPARAASVKHRPVSGAPAQGYRLRMGVDSLDTAPSAVWRAGPRPGRRLRTPAPERLGPGGWTLVLADSSVVVLALPNVLGAVLDIDRAGGLGAGRVQSRARAGSRAHGVALAPGRRTLGHGRGAARARHRLRRLRRRRVDRPADRSPLRAGDRSCGGRRSRPRAPRRGRRRRAPGGEDVDGRRRRGRRPRPGRRRRDHPALLMARGVRDPGPGGRRVLAVVVGIPGHDAVADTGRSAAVGGQRGARPALGRPRRRRSSCSC